MRKKIISEVNFNDNFLFETRLHFLTDPIYEYFKLLKVSARRILAINVYVLVHSRLHLSAL